MKITPRLHSLDSQKAYIRTNCPQVKPLQLNNKTQQDDISVQLEKNTQEAHSTLFYVAYYATVLCSWCALLIHLGKFRK